MTEPTEDGKCNCGLREAAEELASAARQTILTDLTGYTQRLLEDNIAKIEELVGHPIKATNDE